MTRDIERVIDRLQDRIDESEDINDDDRALLREFNRQLALMPSRFGKQRHEKYLRHNTLLAERTDGLTPALEDRTAAENIVRHIHDTHDNPDTNRDYRIAFRVFGELVTKGGDKPDSVAWISSSHGQTHDKTPDPNDMISWDETENMVDCCINSRDKALITFAWDAGCRSGELRDLAIGDLSDHEHGLQVTLEGKTGRRSIILIPSVPYVNRWLSDHPAGDDPDAPLWTKLSESEPLSYNMFRKALRRAAADAGIDKTVTLTNFRKSRASNLASQGLSQAHLEERMGWVRGSRVAARYVSVFDDEADDAFAELHGLEVDRDGDETGPRPLECPRCGRESPESEEKCMWCGQAFSPDVEDPVREVNEEAFEDARNVDDPQTEEAVAELRDLLNRYPHLADEVTDG
jgi:integrase